MKSFQLLTQSCISFIIFLHSITEGLCNVVELVSSLKTKVFSKTPLVPVVNTRVVSFCTWCTNGASWNWWTNWTSKACTIKTLKTSVKFSEKREQKNYKNTWQVKDFFFAALFRPTFVKLEVPAFSPLVVLYISFHPPRICQSLYFFCLSPSQTRSVSFRWDHFL